MKRKIAAAALVLCVAGALGGEPAQPQVILRYEGDSHYHHIRVTADSDGFVYLSFDRRRGLQSAVKLGDPGFLKLAYCRSAFAGLTFLERDPTDVLFVGLGGGTMPMFMRHHYPEVNIDIAEVDPMVVEVARKYFDFNDEDDKKMKVHVKDGRAFIRRTKKKYDVIFLDAYDNDNIPYLLTTQEFLRFVRAKLKKGGCVVSNIWSPTHNKYYAAMVKTYQSVFEELYIFQADNSGNRIFVASPVKGRVERDKVVARAREIARRRPFNYDLVAVTGRQYTYATKLRGDAPVLTDEFAPVNVLRTL